MPFSGSVVVSLLLQIITIRLFVIFIYNGHEEMFCRIQILVLDARWLYSMCLSLHVRLVVAQTSVFLYTKLHIFHEVVSPLLAHGRIS